MQHQQAEDNMKILNFESLEDFNKLFEKDSRMITDEIVKSIEEALNFQKGTAKLFTISIANEEHSFEVTLPKSQWEAALESCLDKYSKWEEADASIDTYLLKKRVVECVG
jgi:hypothetical protein